jgi:hypothetical protein
MRVIGLRCTWLLVCLSLAALVGGCAQPIATSSVERFSQGVTTTTTNPKESLVIVTDIEMQAALVAEAEQFVARDSFTLEPAAFITPDVLHSRFAALDALQEYGHYLSELSGNQQGERVSGAIREAGQTLSATLAIGFPGLPQAAAISPAVLDGGVDGLSQLAKFLVNAQINRSLPPVIEEVDPAIERIVALMKADIGEDTNGDGKADTGLRKILSLRRDELKMGRETLLSRYREDDRVSTAELSNLYQEAASEVANIQSADLALVQVVRSLDEMEQAHKALRNPDAPDTLTRVEEFLAIAERTTRRHETTWSGSSKRRIPLTTRAGSIEQSERSTMS